MIIHEPGKQLVTLPGQQRMGDVNTVYPGTINVGENDFSQVSVKQKMVASPHKPQTIG